MADRKSGSVFGRFFLTNMLLLVVPFLLLIGYTQYIITNEYAALIQSTRFRLNQLMEQVEMSIINIDSHYLDKMVYEQDIIGVFDGFRPPVDTPDEVLALRKAYTRMRQMFMTVGDIMTVVLIDPETELVVSSNHAAVGLEKFHRSLYWSDDYESWRTNLLENARSRRIVREQTLINALSTPSITYARYISRGGVHTRRYIVAVYFEANRFLENNIFTLGAEDYLYLSDAAGDQLSVMSGRSGMPTPMIDSESISRSRQFIALQTPPSAHDLSLTAVIKASDALRPFTNMRMIMYALLAAAILCDVALSVYFARRDAKPLQPILALLSTRGTRSYTYSDLMCAVLEAVESAATPAPAGDGGHEVSASDRHDSDLSKPAADLLRSTKRDAAFERLQSYVKERYGDPQLGMAQIEELLDLSASSVKRLFNEIYGETSGHGLSHYIESVRLQNACEMLAHVDDTISAIAEKVGYTSLVSFSRAFKRVFGVSPMQFRAAAKDAAPDA